MPWKAYEIAAMTRALALAARGRGAVEPNPMVGAVIVKSGRVIAEGFHRRFGGPHAEIEALRKAGRRAARAEVFVTLEPCGHFGKTPPCADALIAAGVSRVVAMKDPFEKVRGRGIARLRKAGVAVDVGLLAAPTAGAVPLSMLSTVGIWLVVWYLVSHMATMVRESDTELAETNRRLLAAQIERSRHMLTTTHQLKAPFAAIHANSQLLLDGYCGPLSDDARQVVARMAARCRRLAAEIQEMLQLANLDSSGQQPLPWVDIDVAEVLKWCVSQIEPMAQARRITVDRSIESAYVRGVEDHLRMLFTNLLSNGIAYSHSGSRVRLRCERGREQEAIVTIADEGIGIAAEKLPRIFDEHYRTNEAVAHNKESSGIGLAIVRRVVDLHRIRLRVVSRPSAGTLFELRFAPPGAALDARQKEEEEHGLPGNG